MSRAFQYQSIIALGTAEPPHRNDRIVLMSLCGLSIMYCWIPNQTVGTPADTVTPSFSMSPTMPAGERSGPGITNLAPTVVPMNVSPQAAA